MATCPTCPRHLESSYPAAICPRCIVTAIYTEAVEAALWDIRYFGREFVTESLTNVGKRAELVLAEDAATLATYPRRLVAVP